MACRLRLCRGARGQSLLRDRDRDCSSTPRPAALSRESRRGQPKDRHAGGAREHTWAASAAPRVGASRVASGRVAGDLASRGTVRDCSRRSAATIGLTPDITVPPASRESRWIATRGRWSGPAVPISRWTRCRSVFVRASGPTKTSLPDQRAVRTMASAGPGAMVGSGPPVGRDHPNARCSTHARAITRGDRCPRAYAYTISATIIAGSCAGDHERRLASRLKPCPGRSARRSRSRTAQSDHPAASLVHARPHRRCFRKDRVRRCS